MKKVSGRSLGKGLDSMFSDKSMVEKFLDENVNEESIQMLDITLVHRNASQPRKSFSEESIAELAESIKENGLIQPIIVRPDKDRYEIIAGERRYRAMLSLNEPKIAAIVREIDNIQADKISIIENVQRVDLNPIDEAMAYKRVIDLYGITQDELAKFIGKSRSYVSNILRILKLDIQVIQMINEGKLSVSHGKALLALPIEKQFAAAQKLISTKASVRTAEKLRRAPDKYIVDVEERLIRIMGTKVHISGNEKKGSIKIEYYNSDDLERIIEFLSRGE